MSRINRNKITRVIRLQFLLTHFRMLPLATYHLKLKSSGTTPDTIIDQNSHIHTIAPGLRLEYFFFCPIRRFGRVADARLHLVLIQIQVNLIRRDES